MTTEIENAMGGEQPDDDFDSDGHAEYTVDLSEDLAALDFSAGLTADGADQTGELSDDATVFAVTNPPGTVTVSTLIGGRVQRIELAPKAVLSTESQLAEEIVVIAGLATQRARAAQFSSMLEGMETHGHDNAATRDFLTRNVGLPSPEDAEAAQARIFANRYAGEHD